MDKNKPIFYNPENKRWPRIKRGLFTFGLISSVIFVGFLASIISAPIVHTLKLPSTTILPGGGHIGAPLDRPLFNPRVRSLLETKAALKKALEEKNNTIILPSTDHPTKSVGFFVDWDDSSFSSLKQNLPNLDIVIGEWIHLNDTKGNLDEENRARTDLAISYVREHKPSAELFALINNYQNNTWQTEQLTAMLSSKDSRAATIQQLLQYVQTNKLNGASVDFEEVSPSVQNNLIIFLKELSTVFHNNNLKVSINVPADDNDFDYKALAKAADFVIVMAYDQHWSSGEAGPISGQDWFNNVISQRKKDIPGNKLIIALGSYGYDWQSGKKEAAEKTYEEAVLGAKESEGIVTTDPLSLNPYYTYADDANQQHAVWFLDASTVFNQMVGSKKVVQPYGYALWRLGSEDPSLWQFFGSAEKLDQSAANELSTIHYGYDLDYEGQGEILQIDQTPQTGQRDIVYDSNKGLILSEHYNSFPSSYIITRHGFSPKKIALTFDDGPDPVYTKQILKILKNTNTPATFFIVGENGERYPEIVKQEYAEGHDIGNHTYTHPNIASISRFQLRLELNTTDRLLQTLIGRGSHLFRPPYAEDVEPETAEEIRPVIETNRLGYITVGMQIDPSDWKMPGVDNIVNDTLTQAEQAVGNVVLLHDSGGNREQTVSALPKLIARLRSHGYQLVTVSDLLGQPQSATMPETGKLPWWQRWADFLGFRFLNLASVILYTIFLTGIIIGLSRLVIVIFFALYQKLRHKPAALNISAIATLPTTAVIIPAYNEEKVIVRTVNSLLNADHPHGFEIIVVDDGSTDGTISELNKAFSKNPEVKIFSVENGGKSEAMNFGLTKTQAEVVITLDADTIFTKDTIVLLTQHFSDPTVGAVAGNTKVGNRINLLTRWQALEYITSQNLDRRAFMVTNSITVVPGAVGAWRTSALKEIGGFSPQTVAEDTDATLFVRKLGMKILYEERAIGITEAPDTVRAFIQQRFRWTFGTMQAAWKHRDSLFRPKYGWFGFITLPNILIYQILLPLVSPLIDLMTLVSLLSIFLTKSQHIDQGVSPALQRIIFYYAIFILIDALAALIAFMLEKRENKKLIVWLFWQRFFYRQLIYYIVIKSIIYSLTGQSVGWNKVERKATVHSNFE
ncbi:MAG: glycosyltransferase [Candidatus Doudnabacteria bacterium]